MISSSISRTAVGVWHGGGETEHEVCASEFIRFVFPVTSVPVWDTAHLPTVPDTNRKHLFRMSSLVYSVGGEKIHAV